MKKNELTNKVKNVLNSYDNQIQELILFGSYANGTQKETSDINIAISKPRKLDVLEFVELRKKLENHLGKTVHLIRLYDAEDENKELYDKIVNEGEILFEKN